jgi:hypothetical protein
MNKDVWNTKGGRHPVESFWAERFIVDPADPLSGPNTPGVGLAESSTGAENVEERRKKQPYFTTEGLEGSWIPFGGKHDPEFLDLCDHMGLGRSDFNRKGWWRRLH